MSATQLNSHLTHRIQYMYMYVHIIINDVRASTYSGNARIAISLSASARTQTYSQTHKTHTGTPKTPLNTNHNRISIIAGNADGSHAFAIHASHAQRELKIGDHPFCSNQNHTRTIQHIIRESTPCIHQLYTAQCWHAYVNSHFSCVPVWVLVGRL